MLTVEIVDATELGRRLRAWRLAQPWPQWYVTEAAARFDLSHGEYCRLEAGEGIVDWLAERPEVAREMGL